MWARLRCVPAARSGSACWMGSAGAPVDWCNAPMATPISWPRREAALAPVVNHGAPAPQQGEHAMWTARFAGLRPLLVEQVPDAILALGDRLQLVQAIDEQIAHARHVRLAVQTEADHAGRVEDAMRHLQPTFRGFRGRHADPREERAKWD